MSEEEQTPAPSETSEATTEVTGEAGEAEEGGTIPVTAQVEANIVAIQRVQKQLKGPSTISFAERQALSRKLGGALEALQALGEDATEEEANAALEKARIALGAVGLSQPATARAAAGGKGKVGAARAGVGGFAQQRSPMRKGGE